MEKGEEEEERTPIDERVKELEEEGLDKRDIVLTLYDEGYNTQEIMKQHLSLRYLRERKKATAERDAMATIAGPTKGPGFMQEMKDMIRAEMGRTRELTEVFYDVGLGILFAALRKSGVEIEDFRKMVAERGPVRDTLKKAAETAFKALEYYESDLITQVEREREEARLYAVQLESKFDELAKSLDPKFRLEKMIYAYVMSGNVDGNVLSTLIDKWLSIEMTGLRRVIAA